MSRRTAGLPAPAAALALALLLAAPLPAAAQDEAQEPPLPPSAEGAPAAANDEAEPPPPPRSGAEPVRFELPMPADQGGGTVVGSAGDLEFERDQYVVLSGGVEARYQDVEIEADRIAVDLETGILTAEGDVIVDQGPRRLSGATLTWDLDEKTGTLTDATGHVAPDYYFSGQQVAKIDEDVYTVTDGVFTSCIGDETPDWSFRLGRATVRVEGYAKVHNAAMRIKKMPVLYSPYVLWPVKTERASGLLIPNVGYSQRRGTYLGMAYYHVLGRSYDTTLFLDGYSEGYVGVGNELRYRPTEGTAGIFSGYAIDDQETGEWRWKVELDHESNDLPFGLRGVASIRETSDFDFFRDWERDFDRAARRFEQSRAFVSGSWGAHLLNIEVSDLETFYAGQPNAIDRRLPEIDYTLRSTQLGGTPLALQVESSAGYLSVDRTPTYQAQYGRFHVIPELSLPINAVPWLSLDLFVGHRFTWYGDSLTDSGLAFTGESLTRSAPFAGAGLIGPSLARLYTPAGGPFAKLLHVIEPRMNYQWRDRFEDQQFVPRFDTIDGFDSGNVGTISLINRLKAKPRTEEGEGDARDIATFEITRRYSFDEDEPLEGAVDDENSQFGPYLVSLRVAPSRVFFLEGGATYSGLFDQLTSTSLSTDLRLDRVNLGLRWNTNRVARTGETLSDQYRFASGFDIVPDRLRLQAWVDYDAERSALQEQRYFLDYSSQCYSLHLEYRDYRPGDLRERDYRLSFTLKNVGSFLDLTGRFE